MPGDTLVQAGEMRGDFDEPLFAISKEVKLARIALDVEAASVRLRAWVGDAAYDDALDPQPDISALPAAEQRFIRQRRQLLKRAEGNLAMSYVIVNLSSSVRPQGLLAETKVEGQTVERFMTPEQTRQRAAEFFDLAIIMIEPYRVTALEAAIECVAVPLE